MGEASPSHGWRGRRRVVLAGLVAVALSAVLALGCSGSSDGTATAEAGADGTAVATEEADATSEATSAPTEAATPEPTEEPEPAELTITSAAFAEGEDIPFRYTCDGANILPPLEFANLPEGTVTLALTVADPDAPGGTWDHWVQFDIAPTDGLAEGASSFAAMSEAGTAGINDFETLTYGGPCPPSGSHRYFFRLYALDADLLVSEGATKDALLAAMEGHILGEAALMGRYERLPAQAAADGLETTPVVGRIGGPYKFVGGQSVVVGLDEFEFEPGAVEAHWYQQGGSYVIVYRGLDATSIGPLCPGNSIQTASGFQNITNAPTADGGCADTVPAAPAGGGVQACGEHLVYVTAIPTSAVGNLYGTIELFDASGALLGMTSAVEANAAATPEIDIAGFCGG